MHLQSAVSFIVVCIAGAVAADNDDTLAIDKFQFSWTVAEIGRTQFLIQKDEKATKAGLRHGNDSISMGLEDAQAVGAALARTDEVLEKLKGTKGQTESIKAGRIRVVFELTKSGEFRVQVTPDNWMRVFATLQPAEAKALAGPMKKAVKAGALVDQKIKM